MFLVRYTCVSGRIGKPPVRKSGDLWFESRLRNNFSLSKLSSKIVLFVARRAGSDGSMSASGSAGPGFGPPRGSKFSFENFQPRG